MKKRKIYHHYWGKRIFKITPNELFKINQEWNKLDDRGFGNYGKIEVKGNSFNIGLSHQAKILDFFNLKDVPIDRNSIIKLIIK